MLMEKSVRPQEARSECGERWSEAKLPKKQSKETKELIQTKRMTKGIGHSTKRRRRKKDARVMPQPLVKVCRFVRRGGGRETSTAVQKLCCHVSVSQGGSVGGDGQRQW